MRAYPVTINPDMPSTHTGIGPQLQRRPRRRVLPVIPAGSSTAYAGSSGSFRGATGAEPEPETATDNSSGDGCCG